jgi:hypothetical protein
MIIWELDYYSRPIVDENGKKRWEVLICQSPLSQSDDPSTLFRYSQYCASSSVNSIWLQEALSAAIAQAGAPPDKIRFFRRQMNNMISQAGKLLGIPTQISRRTIALSRWLTDRLTTVYPLDPGYQGGAIPSVKYGVDAVAPLPDALRGDRWSFVSLPLSSFSDLDDWDRSFGESFPLTMFDLPPDTPIPGLLIYSARALPLAAWMSGLDLACITLEGGPPAALVLETGIADRWLLSPLPNKDLITEVTAFQTAKANAQNLHFIGIQQNPDIESFTGFWLMQELNLD